MERTGTAELPPVVETGGLIGSLEVPCLGLSVVIVEGTNDAQLGRAAGHIKGTALPGEHGNAGIAGHRRHSSFGRCERFAATIS